EVLVMFPCGGDGLTQFGKPWLRASIMRGSYLDGIEHEELKGRQWRTTNSSRIPPPSTNDGRPLSLFHILSLTAPENGCSASVAAQSRQYDDTGTRPATPKSK